MSRLRRSSLALPTLAASAFGAGSVVGLAMAGGLIAADPALLATRLSDTWSGGSPEPIARAATASPPIQVSLPEAPASTRGVGGAASTAQDPVRRARTSNAWGTRTAPRRVTRPAPRRPAAARTSSRLYVAQPMAARVAQPSITLVVERTRANRLVTVKVIDPSRPALSASTPSTTWRRGLVGG
jgi:hypothetical protein